jgi:hypothetical protein
MTTGALEVAREFWYNVLVASYVKEMIHKIKYYRIIILNDLKG